MVANNGQEHGLSNEIKSTADRAADHVQSTHE